MGMLICPPMFHSLVINNVEIRLKTRELVCQTVFLEGAGVGRGKEETFNSIKERCHFPMHLTSNGRKVMG